jgi:uncharacterized membrane protein YccC
MAKKLLLALWLLSLLLPGPLISQTIEENLSTLGNLLDSSIASIERIGSDNEALRQTLENLEASLQTQSLLLREQGRLLSEQEADYGEQRKIYEAQGAYLVTLRRKSTIYKVSLIAAVPVCIGFGTWLGWKLSNK